MIYIILIGRSVKSSSYTSASSLYYYTICVGCSFTERLDIASRRLGFGNEAQLLVFEIIPASRLYL